MHVIIVHKWNIESMSGGNEIKHLISGNKIPYILNQTCNLQLHVFLNMSRLLLSLRKELTLSRPGVRGERFLL